MGACLLIEVPRWLEWVRWGSGLAAKLNELQNWHPVPGGNHGQKRKLGQKSKLCAGPSSRGRERTRASTVSPKDCVARKPAVNFQAPLTRSAGVSTVSRWTLSLSGSGPARERAPGAPPSRDGEGSGSYLLSGSPCWPCLSGPRDPWLRDAFRPLSISSSDMEPVDPS